MSLIKKTTKLLDKSNTIPVFFATDDNYAPLLAVAMYSLVKYSSPNNQYNIYILNTGLSEESVKSISKFETKNVSIQFINVEEYLQSVLSKLHTRDYYTISTYYRLFIPRMFPQYDKVLYLDSDIIILDDIANLYNVDIKNNLLGAVPEQAVGNVYEFVQYSNNYLGICEKMYFNAGILIMNLKELRNTGFEDKFVDLLNKIKFTVAQDQDYLNVICKDKVHYLPLRWNRTPFGKCSDNEDNGIVHFFLSYKPWHYDNVPFEKQFWTLAREAGFFDKILAMKCKYTDKDKQKDAEGYERLKKTALDQANSANPFCKMEFAKVTI